MTTKQDVAAVMASEGDYEKKISLLKKAVVSVTRQKQELETKLTETLHELSEMSDRASRETENNTKMRKRIQALEAELEQERNKGTKFGQNVLKGLSSLVTGNDDNGVGTAPGGARALPSASAIKPEDVEKIVSENQQLHMEVYTLKTKRDDAKRSHHAEKERRLKDMSSLQHEVSELRGLLDATTKACDDLNYQCTHRQALAQFCCTFLRPVRAASDTLRERTIALILQDPEASVEAQSPTSRTSTAVARGRAASPLHLAQQLTSEQQSELIHSTLKTYSSSLRTIMSGTSVFLLTLRDKCPHSHRGTAGDLRSFTARLSTVAEAHALQKERILFLASHLDALLTGKPEVGEDVYSDSPETGARGGRLFALQQDILEAVMEWLRLLRANLALLVDSCVAALPQGHQYELSVWPPELVPGAPPTQQPWESVLKRSVVEREVFVEHVTKMGGLALARIEGSLEAVRVLFERVSDAFKADLDAVGPVWLVAVQQMWLEGVNAQPRLRLETASFSLALEDIAQACHNAALRDALRFMVSSLRATARSTSPSAEDTYVAALPELGTALTAATLPATGGEGHSLSGITDCGLQRGRSASRLQFNNDEVLSALAAADRAAVWYYTQMNATLLELADREDMLRAVEAELQQTEILLEDKTAEAERTRLVLQDQIRLLSDQLIQYTTRHEPAHTALSPRHDQSEQGRLGSTRPNRL